MENELLKRIKEKTELRSYLSEEEQNNLNKVVNFAITWWLKDIKPTRTSSNAKDDAIDGMYDVSRLAPLSEEQLQKVEGFKQALAFSIIKNLLKKPNGMIELHSGYSPDGIIGESIVKSNCYFLNLRLPIKSKMVISKEQVFIKEGYEGELKLAYDVKKTYEFPYPGLKSVPTLSKEDYDRLPEKEKEARALKLIEELLFGKEYILPVGFNPSSYNFFDNTDAKPSYRKARS